MNKHLPTDIDKLSRKELVEIYHIHAEEMQKTQERISELEGKIEKASNIAADFAYIDGAHHKNWVINEMLCAIQTERQLIDNGWKAADWLDECIAP